MALISRAGLASVLAALVVAACGGGGGDAVQTPSAPALSSVSDFPLHTLSVQWPLASATESSGYSNILVPREQYEAAWQQCGDPLCQFGVPGFTTSTGSGGQVNSAFFAGGPSVRAQMVRRDGGSFSGRYLLKFGGVGANLSLLDQASAVGSNSYQNVMAAVAYPTSVSGGGDVVVSADFSTLKIPDGWEAKILTTVRVTLSSSWTDSDGKPAYANIPIYNKTYDGAFSDRVAVNQPLSSFPTVNGAYGTYNLSVVSQVTIRRK